MIHTIRTLSYYKIFMDKPKSEEKIDEIVGLAQCHPDKARGAFLIRAAKQQLTQQELADAKQAVEKSLQAMEQLLKQSKSGFLFGDHYTMADAVGAARLHRFQQLGLDNITHCYPLTQQYYQRMQQRPSFATATLKSV